MEHKVGMGSGTQKRPTLLTVRGERRKLGLKKPKLEARRPNNHIHPAPELKDKPVFLSPFTLGTATWILALGMGTGGVGKATVIGGTPF